MNPGDGPYVRVQCLKNQSVLADKCYVADRFLDRLRGLIGKSELRPGEGILLRPCRDIHMWFMKIPIDVIFIRKAVNAEGASVWKVTSAHENVRPWRPLPLMDMRASDTLELPTGTIGRCAISTGDELCIS